AFRDAWETACSLNNAVFLVPERRHYKALTIDSSSAIRVKGLTVQSAQQMHFTISRSDAVRISGVRILAPEDSPNTDGIHITESSNVAIQNCHIGTGKDNSTAIVTGVVLDTATLTGTENGLRIKTWQTSAVKISQVIYRNISGTSRTPKAMKFACSDSVPCSNIVLNNINLETENGTAETFCNCAMGFDYGIVQPTADCLKSSSCGGVEEDNQEQTHGLIHTEL
ncbi:hypothetical protein BHM03_00041485, partial [Ensete ventricosum]